ncbi:MAG: TlpA disulfide reductase family protein [Gammaproteobacteria bacterium]
MRKGLRAVVVGAGLAVAGQPVLHAQESTCQADAEMANLDFVVSDINGDDIRFSDFKGQVILLDFWATWCAPCRIEIPGFIELYDKYREQGFVVLGFDVDDPVPAIQSFAAEFEMNYPVLVGADRDDVKDAYGPPIGYPTAFIIDREGRICATHTGFAPKERFEQAILALL